MRDDEGSTPGDDAWEWGTWEGARRLQHLEFRALPFREKMKIIEQLSEVAEWFAARRALRMARERRDLAGGTGSPDPA